MKASGKKCDGKIQEWSLDHPKAQDPNAFPNACETSVDLDRLRKAQSLKEIYQLAGKMDGTSISDFRVMSKAASEYMKQNCSKVECALKELKKTGFKDIVDITEQAKAHPERYTISDDLIFDRALYSNQRYARLNFLNFERFEAEYRISVFFHKNNMVLVNTKLFYNSPF